MCALGMMAASAGAQSTDIKIGDAVVSSSLRSRMYSWNWFGDTPNGDYTYSGSLLRFGLTESKKALDWQVEFAVPALVNMPTTAVMPAPFGQLGLGGSPANVTIVLAALAVAVVWWLRDRTTWGQAWRAVGQSPQAARTTGISVGKVQIFVMAGCGALAGVGVMVEFSSEGSMSGDLLAFAMTLAMAGIMVIARHFQGIAVMQAIALFALGSRLLPAIETGLIGSLDAPLAPVCAWLAGLPRNLPL